MRDKTPLVLIEQLIMLLVFALAAALCLRAFVWADGESKRGEARDHAVLAAEAAAETLKAYGGDFAAAAADFGGSWDGESWRVSYDAQWNLTSGNGAFSLQAAPIAEDLEYLSRADITVSDAEGACLTQLQLAWQEVGADD